MMVPMAIIVILHKTHKVRRSVSAREGFACVRSTRNKRWIGGVTASKGACGGYIGRRRRF